MNCPDCHGKNIIKYGKIHNGKQRFECKDCDRQFVENPQNKNISEEIKKSQGAKAGEHPPQEMQSAERP